MKLLIVESPTKAKTITKYLGDTFTVRASVGHIRDLPTSNKNAIDIPAGFTPHYVIPEGKEHIVKELKTLAQKAAQIVLATDPDREGEAIAWHITQALGLDESKVSSSTQATEGIKSRRSKENSKFKIRNSKLTPIVQRVAFHEITPTAIKEALTHPRNIDMDLVKAQEARRVLDRLFGYDLSGLLWKKLRYGLSAGRVQSPALRILMEREREIRAFIPRIFFVIDAIFTTAGKKELPFVCSIEPATEAEATHICDEARRITWHIATITQTESTRLPRAPFTTSTLQQSASSRLGYSPSITMRLAQRLYEAGHITYMRTDSTTLSAQALAEAHTVIEKRWGSSYAQQRIYKTTSKNAQEAHEAIRPTHLATASAGASAQEKKLYELIWKRTITSQMTEAYILKTTVTAVDTKATLPSFITTGSQITFDGWLKADPASRSEENELPPMTQGASLTLNTITATQKQTEPPHRYSEAGLIKELEKRGIGRPSTYASIIKTIIDRGYVQKEQRSLQPTETGEVVDDFLEKHFAAYISDSFTADMEDELDDIATGKRNYSKTLAQFYTPFKKEVASKNNIPKITNLGDAPANIRCPECGGAMIIKLSRGGKFYSCARFPDCTGALTLEGKKLEGPKETGEPCPQCGEGKLVEREGKFGKFVSCNRYPKCKYIKKDALIDGNNPNDTGVVCPVCKKGTMIQRKGKFGVFYSCSQYPTCKHIIKSKPTGALCSLCGSLMMEGTKTIPERCSSKACPNHNPHKLNKK